MPGRLAGRGRLRSAEADGLAEADSLADGLAEADPAGARSTGSATRWGRSRSATRRRARSADALGLAGRAGEHDLAGAVGGDRDGDRAAWSRCRARRSAGRCRRPGSPRCPGSRREAAHLVAAVVGVWTLTPWTDGLLVGGLGDLAGAAPGQQQARRRRHTGQQQGRPPGSPDRARHVGPPRHDPHPAVRRARWPYPRRPRSRVVGADRGPHADPVMPPARVTPVRPPDRSPPAGPRRSAPPASPPGRRPPAGRRPGRASAAGVPAERRHHGGGARPPTSPAHDGGPGGPRTRVDGRGEQQPGGGRPGCRPAPSRCGRPRTPVRASSARSGSTLAKCAPAPSRPPAATSQTGGAGAPGSASTTKAGSAPKETAYGSTETGGGLQRPVVEQRGDQADAWPRPPRPGWWSAPAAGWPARPAAAARPTVRRPTAPVATGLSVRPTVASRSASSAVVGPADGELAGQHGEHHRRRSRPAGARPPRPAARPPWSPPRPAPDGSP